MPKNPIPRVTAIGARAATVASKPCRNRNNSAGHNRECPCGWAREGRPPQTVPYDEDALNLPVSPYVDFDELEDMDDPAYIEARFESDRLDADVDRVREETHFG
ncbi:hypothetical protein ACWGOE_04300 [Leucobacter chromiiresistens]